MRWNWHGHGSSVGARRIDLSSDYHECTTMPSPRLADEFYLQAAHVIRPDTKSRFIFPKVKPKVQQTTYALS